MCEFSVIVPVYNSKDTLEELYSQITDFFTGENNSYEVVFVDDCSTDNSWDVITTMQLNHKHIIGIKLSKNSGQHHATSCGITHAQGNFIVTIDDDLQIYPSEIGKLLATQNKTRADVVYGIYPQKKHSIIRNWGASSLKRFLRNMHRPFQKAPHLNFLKLILHIRWLLIISNICILMKSSTGTHRIL